MEQPADRVRTLIGESGLTQSAFAAEIGLDPTKLSKSLSGSRRFSSLDLARIAERSKVSVDWILSGVESPLATAARASDGSSSAKALSVANDLVELRESAARLGYPQRVRLLAEQSSAGRAVDQGVELAARALERLEAEGLDVATLDLATLIEHAFGIDVCLSPLGDGFDGLAATTEHARVIVAAVTPVAFRQRFTVAHELAHTLVGDDQGIHTDVDVYSAESRRGASEIRANAFAAALLMPEGLLREAVRAGFGQKEFAQLAMKLMVSPSALAYRLESLRLIDAMARDQWRAMSAKQAARLAGASAALAAATAYSTEPRHPGLLARDLFEAYLEEKTTLRPYANLIGVDARSLRDDLERSETES